MKKVFHKNHGFTLVEMIVALMIFSIVAVVALAALVKIIDANKKAQTIQDAVVNMSFTMESMTRELRQGSTYYCEYPLGSMNISSLSARSVATCAGGVSGTSGNGVGFAFLSNRTATQGNNTCRLINAYEMSPNSTNGTFNGTFTFKKASQTSCGGALSFVPAVDINALSLTNYFMKISDAEFPLLFIKLEGNSGTRESIKTYFSLQTAASPRIP